MTTTKGFEQFCNDMEVSTSKMIHLMGSDSIQGIDFQATYDTETEIYEVNYNLNGFTIEKTFTFSDLTI